MSVHAQGTRFPLSSSDARTRPDGNFLLELRLPISCNEILVVANSTVPSDGFVTYPERSPVVAGVSEVECTLVARTGGRIEGSVQASDPALLRSAQVLVVQVPRGDPEPYHGWNASGFASLSQIIVPGADGAFSAMLRPGHFRLRVLSAAGVLGEVVSGSIAAGQVLRLPAMHIPGEGVQQRLVITGDHGAPIPGAHIQLSDADPALLDAHGNGESPHFVTDHAGQVSLPLLDASVFPIGAAIAAPGYAAILVDLQAESGTRSIILHGLPRLVFRLGGGIARADAGVLTKIRIALEAQDPILETPPGQQPPPLEILETGSRLRGPLIEVVQASPGILATTLPMPGRYRVTLLLGSSPLGAGVLEIPSGAELRGDVVVPVDSGPGRIASVRLSVPAQIPRTIVAQQLRLALAAGEDDPAPVALAAGDVLADEVTHVWVPIGKSMLVASSKNPSLLPVRDVALPIADGHLDCQLTLSAAVGELAISVTGAGDVPVRSAWPLRIVGPLDGGTRVGIVSLTTDPDGRSQIALRPGDYEIRTERSFVQPFAKMRARVTADTTSEVRISVVDP